MKTTYILAGGNDRITEGYDQRLGEEITRHITEPRVLSCFFSAPKEEWEEKSRYWKVWFSKSLNQPFTYDCAKPDTLLEQMDAADVVYFHGGDTKLLFEALPETAKLKEHMQGKIVIGSSAGSNMLSKYYWSSSRGVFGEGRGIVDINVMVHYGASNVEGRKRTAADWQKEEAAFKERIGENEKIVHLPEGEFVRLETDSDG